MCGIAGICNPSNNWKEQIHKMNEKMIHRGPDNEGIWCSDNHCIALGHRRLAIVDITDDGNQPFVSASGRYVMVFNGEIYNHREIKRELLTKKNNIDFKSRTDTEILIESVDCFGLSETLEMCSGMFAIAIYDRKEKSLFLVRDRMGEKPLYYGFVDRRFVFASDIGCFEVLEGFSGRIDTKTLDAYFNYGCIPAPYSIYENIYKLEPGKILTIKFPFRIEDIKITEYWNLRNVALSGEKNCFQGNFSDATEELERLLKESIKKQMMADVPVGAFLSGGVDSTVVTALMQKCSGIHKVKTFTIGMKNSSYDETIVARETSKILGTDHTEMYIDEKDVLECIPMMSEIFSEPLGDSSQIPTYLVSKLTKQHVTVVISGDGGDELFCGYNYYIDAINKWNKVKKIPVSIRNITKKLTQYMIRNSKYKNNISFIGSNSVEDIYRLYRYFDTRYCLLNKYNEKYPTQYDQYKDGFLQDDLSNIMLMSQLFILPDDILAKVDRTAMKVSLETRIPLFDKDIIEYAWCLPSNFKYDGKEKKKILKEVLKNNITTDHMDKKKKGFSIPIHNWLKKDPLLSWAEDTLFNNSINGIEGYIKEDVVSRMWKNYKENDIWSQQIWYVLMFKMWCKNRKVIL